MVGSGVATHVAKQGGCPKQEEGAGGSRSLFVPN